MSPFRSGTRRFYRCSQPYDVLRRLRQVDGGNCPMKRARFAVFGLLLGGAIVAGVGALGAQGPAPPSTEGQSGPRARARAMMLDGRGGRIGVIVDDLTPDDLKALSGATSGVRIQNVDEDSPAAKAGLRAGDVVVEFDG